MVCVFSVQLNVKNPINSDSMDTEETLLRNTITVECQKLNGKLFNGTVNFSKAKIKI